MAANLDAPKYIYADILIALVQTDTKVDARERGLLDDILAGMDLDPTAVEEMWLTPRTMDVIKAQLAGIDSPTFKHCLLKDCFLLAYADNEFEASENRFIKSISEVMQVTDEVKQEIHQWVKTSMEQQATAVRLFGQA